MVISRFNIFYVEANLHENSIACESFPASFMYLVCSYSPVLIHEVLDLTCVFYLSFLLNSDYF